MTQYAARHLPNLPGPAAWNAILGGQEVSPQLEGENTADFVIIGGGFAGLSAARRLRQLQPSAKIIVLEATAIAEGSAGRNSGFMIDLPHDISSDNYAGANDDRAIIKLNRMAIAFARATVADYAIDANFFDESGKINGASSAAALEHNRSYAQHLATLGEDSTLLDQQQMVEITGSRHYLGGLYSAGTVMLQPAGYIRGLAEGVRREGVAIAENSPVLAVDRAGVDWAVKTPLGRVVTPRVLITVNGHLESFGFEKGRLVQIFLYAVMTPELGGDELAKLGGQNRWGVTPSDPMGTTVRRIDRGQGGNRIITRTCATVKSNTQLGKNHVAHAAKVMQGKFDQRFPRLAGMAMEYAWAGHLCLAMNGVSVAKKLDDGVFSGCVQNGLGTARGTLTGIAAAELACGETSPITEHFSTEPRPKRLPPQPFRDIGANITLKYRQWRAKDD